jgi:hypothetical protein
MIQGMSLVVDIQSESVTYLLRQGSTVSISHQGEKVQLTVGVPCTRPLC